MFYERSRGVSRRRRYANLADAGRLLIATIVVQGLSSWNAVGDSNEGAFRVNESKALGGFLPHITFFDINSTGPAPVVAAPLQQIGENLTVPQIVGVTCVFTTAMLIRILTARLGVQRALSLCAAFLYITFSTGLDSLAGLNEIVLAPLTVACALLMVSWFKAEPGRMRIALMAAAGLSCGIAMLIKVVPILPDGLTLVVLLCRAHWDRRVGAMGAVAAGLIFGLFAAVPMVIALVVSQAWLPYEYAHVGFVFSNWAQPDLTTIGQKVIRISCGLWPLVLLSCLALADGAGDMLSSVRRAPLLTVLCACWLLGEIAAGSASVLFYQHRFLMTLPPLCVLSVQGAAILYRRIGVTQVGAPIVLALALGLVPLAPLLARSMPATASDGVRAH
jgi:4-amino-4-deoxy-L-arabinose transferase-like glycosyltransferase